MRVHVFLTVTILLWVIKWWNDYWKIKINHIMKYSGFGKRYLLWNRYDVFLFQITIFLLITSRRFSWPESSRMRIKIWGITVQCMLFVYTFHLLHCEWAWDAIMIFSFLGILDWEIHSPTPIKPGLFEISLKPGAGGRIHPYPLTIWRLITNLEVLHYIINFDQQHEKFS